ncbi:type II toxin-antitoxin system RelE/ParE family toxin [Saprospiraceae bacterium]|nr:type II toxin-antitoxin system RelE/ParE family toxin [Saprospiraceae bacterium]
MDREITWSPEALELLEGILTYWEERNGSKNYSIKLNKYFQDVLRQGSKYPESGRATRYQNVNYRIVKDYFIYYVYSDSSIEVISLCDMRRNPDYIKSLLDR